MNKNQSLGKRPARKAERTHHVVVLIGRFRPLHKSHLKIIKEALGRSEIVVIVVGSAFAARNERNPWTLAEVEQMIRACIDQDEQSRVYVRGVSDVFYDHDVWETSVRKAVSDSIDEHNRLQALRQAPALQKPKIAIIGCEKDHTSYYLEKFPEWNAIIVEQTEMMSSTEIRGAYFHNNLAGTNSAGWEIIANVMCPAPVVDFLADFAKTDDYQWLRQEIQANQRHREPFAECANLIKYKMGFETELPQVAADIALIQSGHILLTQRMEFPGKGLWSLPGTFLGPNETLEDCAFRGLKDKTHVRVPEEILRANIKVQSGYHHPHRSARGRILTEAFLIHLPRVHQGDTPYPKVRGPADYRYRPWWMSLADLRPEDCYEDHYLIIQDLLRRSRRD